MVNGRKIKESNYPDPKPDKLKEVTTTREHCPRNEKEERQCEVKKEARIQGKRSEKRRKNWRGRRTGRRENKEAER